MMRSLAAILLASASALADEPRVVEAEGQAAILEGDLAGARERARDDALRGCVRQVAMGVASAATDPDQAQLLADRVEARAESYVRKFSAGPGRQDGSTWVTRLRCEVAEGKLLDDLMAAGIAYRREGMPRVSAVIAEEAPDHVAERAFAERLGQCGFALVEANAPSGDAEVVITGRATVKPLGTVEGENGTFWSAAASASARAVRAGTGEVIAVSEIAPPASKGFDEAGAARSALADAGRRLAADLFAKVGIAWSKDRSAGRRIALAVRGIDGYARLSAFKSALASGVRGVRAVKERSIEDGRADLEVTLTGTAQAFATDLATRRLQGFTVKVRSVTADAVEVDVE